MPSDLDEFLEEMGLAPRTLVRQGSFDAPPKVMDPQDPRWKTAEAADPAVVLEEHKGNRPEAYMAVGNLKNILSNAEEILGLLNDKDELPAWVEELIAAAKMTTTKALHYIRARKTPPGQVG